MSRWLVVPMVVGLLVACSTTPVTAPPPSPAPSSTASVPDQWNALAHKAKIALAAEDAFAPGGPWKEDRPMLERRGVPEVLRLCGPVQVEPGWVVTEGRIWFGAGLDASQFVNALSEVEARDMVERIRTRARDCREHVPREGMPQRVVSPDADVAAPSGLDDFYAYCETAHHPTPGLHQCTAVMARDDLLVTATGWGYGPAFVTARANALDGLRQVVPVVAEAVLAA